LNRREYLLSKVAEEGGELGQRAIKAMHFGLDEIQPNQEGGETLNNAERLIKEFADLLGIMEMLEEGGHISLPPLSAMIQAKKAKVEKFMLYSIERGALQKEPEAEVPF
jgi:hypothetical protein